MRDVTRRDHTLQRVDEIAVFDHGRIVEHGDREDLVGDDASRFSRLLTLSLEVEEPATARAGASSGEGS